jgi:outer membrane protein TolC
MTMTPARSIFAAGLLLAAALPAQPALKLDLDGSVQAALKASHSLRAARLEVEAAADNVKAARAAALPRLSLDGSYRWVKEIPEVKLSPAAPAAKFGDNNNYSLGVSATWDLFGAMGTWRQYQVAEAAAKAKRADADFQERALRLRVRLAYYQTQLAATKLRLLAQSLNLAQSQDQDLQLRLKAGSSSRIDALSASNEELDRRSQFRLAQADLAAALRELFALTGEGQGADVSLPMVDATGQSLPSRVEDPTLVVSFEDTGSLLKELQVAGDKPFNPALHPRMRALLALVEMARRQADAAYALHWPRGSVGAKQSLDYPNGPVLEQVNQTQFTAGIRVPLYSFGAVADQVDAGVAQAKAAGERGDAAVTELERDYAKSRDRLAALKAERGLLEQRSAQAEDLQNLVYRAYKIGGANYLEVQSSGLRSLQAGLDLAVAETQMLIELANLSALTEADR